MIVRTIVPVISAPGPETTRYSGIGDIQEQVYLTPSKGGSVIWGAGPGRCRCPRRRRRPARRGAGLPGPTFVALTMPGPGSSGPWSTTSGRSPTSGSTTKVNQFLLQPFVNFNFGKGWAISTVPVITADWDAESGQQWTVPIGIGIGRTTVFSGRPMTLAVHYYRNVVRPDSAAADQVRFMAVMLFPKTRDRTSTRGSLKNVAVELRKAGKQSHEQLPRVRPGRLRPAGPRLHRLEPGEHGTSGQHPAGPQDRPESEVPGAGPRVGLGGRAGPRLPDHADPSPRGALSPRWCCSRAWRRARRSFRRWWRRPAETWTSREPSFPRRRSARWCSCRSSPRC